jgi:DNA-binding MarR family transcriptional regulator
VTDTDDAGAALDALLVASRTLVAISAPSIATVMDEVDLVQLRLLVVVASRGPCSLGGVAEAVGLHVSTASRTCDRLVAMGLLDRNASPADRRNLELTLTSEGEALVGRVMRGRRAALEPVLAKLTAKQQRRLATALRDFAEAAGEPSDRALWAMGWATDPEPDDPSDDQEDRT